jgi:two-component system, oxyanion-binding sensor
MVYPFSCHNYDLRYWLASAGIHPDHDINLVVVPPPLIADALKSKRIDGFCVGEPWNSVAVAESNGVILKTKAEMWPLSAEKVLAFTVAFATANRAVTEAMTCTILEACQWLEQPGHRQAAAKVLSDDRYVGVPEHLLLPVYTDRLARERGYATAPSSSAIVFSGDHANFPWPSYAMWLLTQMIRWGQVRTPFALSEIARTVYATDVYRRAAQHLGVNAPAEDFRLETAGEFFRDHPFDGRTPLAYLRGQRLRDDSVDLARFRDHAT